MPEFQLDHGSPDAARQFQALDSFTQGYIEAMFFTSTGTGDDAESDLEHATVAELAPEAIAKCIADCQAFQTANAADLDLYIYDHGDRTAGHDFWYSRNGHGTGFWDRKIPENGPQAWCDRLHDAAKHSEVNLYRGDDGLIYLA